jgi:predicted TIM-barrel fold metal-dependent hydrolase
VSDRDALDELISTIGLVDHHCHGLTRGPLDRDTFELLATESDWPSPTGHSIFDSPVGLSFRRYCAPLLDLPRHCSGDDYWARRQELGEDEVARRLMGSTGIDTYVVDTGFRSDAILDPTELAAITGTRSAEIVRLEALAESVAAGTTAEGFVDAFDSALAKADADAVGYKSIIAYRYGLDFDPNPPDRGEVVRAVGQWLARSEAAREAGSPLRLDDPIVLRHLLHRAVEQAKPLQFHVGYGDSDITLYRCDPTRMTGFIQATRTSGTSIMLLHNYPFVREAGFLAQVYPHVYLDTGAIVNYTGWSSDDVIRESFELAPFHKVLFSSDAFGPPELYASGVALWRRGVSRLFGGWLDEDGIGLADAQRYVRWAAAENAQRVYGLDAG